MSSLAETISAIAVVNGHTVSVRVEDVFEESLVLECKNCDEWIYCETPGQEDDIELYSATLNSCPSSRGDRYLDWTEDMLKELELKETSRWPLDGVKVERIK